MTGLQDAFTMLGSTGTSRDSYLEGPCRYPSLRTTRRTQTDQYFRDTQQSPEPCSPPTPVNSRRKVGASALPRSNMPDCAFAEAVHHHRNLGRSGLAAGSDLAVKEALVSKAKIWE